MLNSLEKLLVAAVVLVSAASVTGCSEGPVDDSAGTAYFSPLETTEVSSQTIPQPQLVPENERANVDAVVEGFSRSALKFFERGDPEGRLPEIEAVFIASGHYLDLVGIYQNVVEKQGISSQATPRLARAYLRLGQEHTARELLDKMIAERGDEALTWFLNGAFWLPKAEGSKEASAKVIASWQKALAIDPNFEGFEQQGAPPLREQLAALRQRTPKEDVEEAVAALGEAPAEPTPDDEAETETESEDQEPEAQAETAPVAEAAAPEAAAPEAAGPQAAAPQAAAPEQAAEPVAVTIARGQMALSQGQSDQAKQFFNKALERDPDNVEARLGLVQNAWRNEDQRNELARTVRKLAERDDLTPRQQYEIGLFAFTKMSANDLAIELWQDAKERDPALAKSVGLDGLIERAKR
jgi:tetratricopeptide (TPR) repeat protein